MIYMIHWLFHFKN